MVALHFESQLDNYLEVTTNWQPMPDELSTCWSGLRMLKMHTLWSDFIMPRWEGGKLRSSATLSQKVWTFELGSKRHGLGVEQDAITGRYKCWSCQAFEDVQSTHVNPCCISCTDQSRSRAIPSSGNTGNSYWKWTWRGERTGATMNLMKLVIGQHQSNIGIFSLMKTEVPWRTGSRRLDSWFHPVAKKTGTITCF